MVLQVVQLNTPCLAGSTLLPLTMSGGLSGAVSPTGGRYGSVTIDASICGADAHSVDLLPLAFHRSSEHYSFLCHFERYDTNKLSSGYFDLYLPLPWALTSHNFEALDVFFNRGHTFIFVPVSKKRMLITCCYFPSCSYA
jgi:hypothetical protein